jgi:predicted dienelactone hydrolase
LGCGIQSIPITETLARYGYIVAAPDHADAALCHVDGTNAASGNPGSRPSLLSPQNWNDMSYGGRRADDETVIDEMLGDRAFGEHIDSQKIAALGHSLGGYDTLGLAGAWKTWRDPRIKALVLYSPYLVPYETQKTLSQVHVPVMYQGGTLDWGITPFLEGKTGAYALSNPPKCFVVLKNATHFEWTNLICAGQTSVSKCLQAKTNAQLMDFYTIEFLNQYVKGIYSPLLYTPRPGLGSYSASR